MKRPSAPKQVLIVVATLAIVGGSIALVIMRGPNWRLVRDAFTAVQWPWVAVALGMNLLSIVTRSVAWKTVIDQAQEPPVRYRSVFSAFSVGLLANAVLPGRIGELARVAVLTRRLKSKKGVWATLVGTVFAHRVFDVFPVLVLIVFVLATAKIPSWATTSLELFVVLGLALFVLALVLATRRHRSPIDGLGPVRRLVTMARYGLAVLHTPVAAAIAILFQFSGWLLQLLAVYSAMRAFGIHEAFPVAALVLLLMNVATIFPLWPGNFGLVQVAVALPLVSYGVAYARGFAFGIGLQAIEASVGVGLGMIFLTREGLSYASLKEIPEPGDYELETERDKRRAAAWMRRNR